ncbi:hypothetical protein V8E55_001314 [Tylopilus felleus]
MVKCQIIYESENDEDEDEENRMKRSQAAPEKAPQDRLQKLILLCKEKVSSPWRCPPKTLVAFIQDELALTGQSHPRPMDNLLPLDDPYGWKFYKQNLANSLASDFRSLHLRQRAFWTTIINRHFLILEWVLGNELNGSDVSCPLYNSPFSSLNILSQITLLSKTSHHCNVQLPSMAYRLTMIDLVTVSPLHPTSMIQSRSPRARMIGSQRKLFFHAREDNKAELRSSLLLDNNNGTNDTAAQPEEDQSTADLPNNRASGQAYPRLHDSAAATHRSHDHAPDRPASLVTPQLVAIQPTEYRPWSRSSHSLMAVRLMAVRLMAVRLMAVRLMAVRLMAVRLMAVRLMAVRLMFTSC